MTEYIMKLALGCKRARVNGFYASSQGGKTFRFQGTDIFQKYFNPTDLAIWEEIQTYTLKYFACTQQAWRM